MSLSLTQSALIMLGIIILKGISQFLIMTLIQLSSDNLTSTLRNKMFNQIIYQQISWYNPDMLSKLPSIFTYDSINLDGLTIEYHFAILQVFLTFALGLAASFYYCWQIVLVAIGLLPLLLVGGCIRNKVMGKWDNENEGLMTEDETILVNDTMNNYRTIISFGQ